MKIGRIKKSFSIQLGHYEQSDMRKKINKYYVNDKEVNKALENGSIVGKYDDHKNFKKLLNAHYSLAATYHFDLWFEVHSDGTIRLPKHKEKSK